MQNILKMNFITNLICDCQDESNAMHPYPNWPIREDHDRWSGLKQDIKKDLANPDRISYHISNYDVFDPENSPKWQEFLAFLKLFEERVREDERTKSSS